MEKYQNNNYSVFVVDNVSDSIFKQLEELIKQFAIEIYFEQNIVHQDVNSYINDDIESRIKFAKDSINNKKNDVETRYYLLMHNDKAIAFQTAQVRKNGAIYEGWRNFAYTLKEYRGKIDIVIDSYGKLQRGFLNNILYDNITTWFNENNVVIERTATGINMHKHICAYIVSKGFIPERVDNTRVYLIKDYSNLKDKKELKRIYKKYIKRS